jgi:hypothetical protein
METTTIATPVIPKPKVITPVVVEIIQGTEYPDELWERVIATIDAAEAEVVKARIVKRKADAEYEAAMIQREAVQEPRDQMILTDRRVSARVGRLAGIGRARCSQIRIRLMRAATTPTDAENAA